MQKEKLTKMNLSALPTGRQAIGRFAEVNISDIRYS